MRFLTRCSSRVLLSLAVLAGCAAAQDDWPVYGHDPGGARYSPLKQITPANVAKLQPLWTWDVGEKSNSFETTPLVIDHVMYISTPAERVVAVDADTGKELWAFDPKVKNPSTHRGVSYWPGQAQDPPRIIFGTSDGRIFALAAKTGQPAISFGDNGVVDYRSKFPEQFRNSLYGISSPPAIYQNLLIFGPRTQESGAKGPSGEIRALDVLTGKQVWSFHTLPQPGEPGYETWGPDFWKDGAGPSAWAALTLDAARGIVFVPVGNPSGGEPAEGRKGINLYSNSVVALKADTGKMLWYYQMVHHDVWDYDVTAPPTLIDVVQNGKKLPAVAQLTKQGLVFVLDRLTGKPIFGAEERKVPTENDIGEFLSPTQPFPLKPVPVSRNSITAAELSKISPEAEKYCAEQFATHVTGPPFTPRSTKPQIFFPSTIGGGNWGGVTFAPDLGLMFVHSSNLGALSAGRGGRGGGNRFVDQQHYPCNQPPWGELYAISANTGNVAWKVPFGSYKELEAKGIRDAGAVSVGGGIVTASGILFIGATNDRRFRAYEAKTGKLLWQIDVDGNALALPITYTTRDGRQLLAVGTGGPSYIGGVGPAQDVLQPGKITVYALPK